MLSFLVHKIFKTYRYSPQYAFYIFSQQIHLIIFLVFLSPSSFIPPQKVVYFLMLPFLVHKIFTFYINGVLNCKCPAPGPKGKVKVTRPEQTQLPSVSTSAALTISAVMSRDSFTEPNRVQVRTAFVSRQYSKPLVTNVQTI